MTIPRPFTVHYNPYTQNIEVVDSKQQILRCSSNIKKYKIETYLL